MFQELDALEVSARMHWLQEMQRGVAFEFFRSDPFVRAFGIGFDGQEIGFRIYTAISRNPDFRTRDTASSEALKRHVGHEYFLDEIHLDVPPTQAQGTTQGAANIQSVSAPPLECARQRPLCWGAEIENHSLNLRTRALPGQASLGSIGCFAIDLDTQAAGLVSCSHVLAPRSMTLKDDLIVQPAFSASIRSGQANGSGPVAEYRRATTLRDSPFLSNPGDTNLNWNEFDLGFAAFINQSALFRQSIHASHAALPAASLGEPRLGDTVIKAGCGSGLTEGRITSSSMYLPVQPAIGNTQRLLWFSDVFAIKSHDGSAFSKPGDCGAVVVHKDSGAILGMLIAGSEDTGFAFPLKPAFDKLRYRLA